MNFDLQTIVALAVTSIAAAYLMRRVWRLFAGQSGGCGSCASGGCGKKAPDDLIELQLDKPRV